MNTIEQIIRNQKEELQKVHNYRFSSNGVEYRVRYDGGLAEFISIYSRTKPTEEFRYVAGFPGYRFSKAEQAAAHAEILIEKISKN